MKPSPPLARRLAAVLGAAVGLSGLPAPLGLTPLAGCAAPAPPEPLTGVAIPVEDTTPRTPHADREPPPAPPKPYRFPPVVWSELPSGLKVATIASRTASTVEVRVVVAAGRSADGEQPGLADLTAHLLEKGGAGALSGKDLAAKLASLGADLSIDVGLDAATFGLATPRDRLGEALDLLGTLIARPLLPPAAFGELKKREAERLAEAARTRGDWSATRVLYGDLFMLPSEHHPYATWSATASEVQKLTAAAARSFHRRFYVPKNAFVVIAGNTTHDAAAAAVRKAFAGFRGGEPPVVSFTDPNPPATRRITLLDRPKSPESEVFVGALGPARTDGPFAAFAVAAQILGGAGTGRLDHEVREQVSPASSASTSVAELAHSPSVLVARAATPAATTGLALAGLLDQMERMTRTVAGEDEIDAAQRFLSRAVQPEGMGAVANEVLRLHLLGLPDDHDDGYRRELGEITPALVLKAATDHLRSGHEVVVVAGDAGVVGQMLSHFGEVKVLDPTRDFARVRSIAMNPDAPLTLPRQEGPRAAREVRAPHPCVAAPACDGPP